jgi:predicted phosphodiesterase
MKKVIVLGDIHGRDIWKKIIENESDFDLVIFVGDYFDSFDIDIMTQIHNFRDIIAFRNENPGKVITLLGNHDFHYTSGCIGSYSGFDYNIFYNMRLEIDTLIKDGTLLIAHQIGNYLFTHAGVTKTFCEENGIDTDNLVESLNEYLIFKPNTFNFKSGKNRSAYGDDITQGPLWVRPNSLLDDGLNYIHVIGHTGGVSIRTDIVDNRGYVNIDCIEYGNYLELIIPDEGDIIINNKSI